jgi:hypothetical protein
MLVDVKLKIREFGSAGALKLGDFSARVPRQKSPTCLWSILLSTGAGYQQLLRVHQFYVAMKR